MKNKALAPILVLVVILILGGISFFVYQAINKPRPQKIDDGGIGFFNYTPTPSSDASTQPVVNIIPNSTVKSPLIITGAVPVGWMFEGNVPVKLLDENRKVIAQAPGGEVNAGTWMDEEPDEFTATLTFTTAAKKGYIVVSKDNPSGLPENDESYEIPVKF